MILFWKEKESDRELSVCSVTKYLKMASDFGRRSDVFMDSRLQKGGQVRGNYVLTNKLVMLHLSDI